MRGGTRGCQDTSSDDYLLKATTIIFLLLYTLANHNWQMAIDNRAEAVFLLDTPPCYVVMTGIKLKKGATPICKVVPKPEEDKKDKKKKDKKKN